VTDLTVDDFTELRRCRRQSEIEYSTSPGARRAGVTEHRLYRVEGRGGEGIAKQFPLILSFGRVVECEGGGEASPGAKLCGT